jgi:hypothetical protein
MKQNAADCDCHDRFNVGLGHYLGATLLVCVVGTLWLGVSGRVKEAFVASAMTYFKEVSLMIVGGFLTAWNIKGREKAEITGGQKGPGSKVEVEEKKDA